jgi:hypothetical protein
MWVEYNINKVQDMSYPLAQYGLLDVHSPVAPGLTYQEPPSLDASEQQPGEFEEGKYNMNIPPLLNTNSYCILILYAYKDSLATFILYIYTLGCIWVSFG